MIGSLLASLAVFVLAPCLWLRLAKTLRIDNDESNSPIFNYLLAVCLGLFCQGELFQLASYLNLRNAFWALNLLNAVVTIRLPKDRVVPAGDNWLIWLTLLAVAHSCLLAGLFWANFPFGNMDAYCFWLLKARFFAEGGEAWKNLYNPAFANADYPTLYSATVAAVWTANGKLSTGWVLLIQEIFYLGICALVYQGVRRVGEGRACIAVLLLCSNVFLIYRVSSLYADIPLTFLFTLVCGALAKEHLGPTQAGQIGLVGGLAVATKQEGIVFYGMAVALFSLRAWRCGQPGLILRTLLFSAPILAMHYGAQGFFRESEPILTPKGGASLFFNPSRYPLVIRSLLSILFDLRWWSGLCAAPLLGLPWLFKSGRAEWKYAAALALGQGIVMTAYFVITPLPQPYHLDSAHSRLLLQVWPGLLLAVLAGLPKPKQEPT